jgi:hypothetical protein
MFLGYIILLLLLLLLLQLSADLSLYVNKLN